MIREQTKINYKFLIKNEVELEVLHDFTDEQIKKIEHYEGKKQGLYEITKEKLRDELYNNKHLFELN